MVLLGVDLLQVLHHLLQAIVVPLVQVLFTSTVSHRLSVETVLGDEKPMINIVFSRLPQYFLLEANRGSISVFPRANFVTQLWEPLKHTSPPFHASWDSHRIHQYHPCTWGNRGNQGGRLRARSSQFGNIGKALPWLEEIFNITLIRYIIRAHLWEALAPSRELQGCPVHMEPREPRAGGEEVGEASNQDFRSWIDCSAKILR